ncbi:MAG: class I SAM-dependent methyltransferase [Cyclobacteriaceae bacterium]
METNPKNLFSQHSKEYAAFRPTYPKELYDFILRHVKNFDVAWDCATGNGQAAKELALRFKQVQATDISAKQIENATKRNNIFYSVGQAEKALFADNSFDLITVAQAIHWINFDLFYPEVVRVAKPNAVLAVWGYSLLSIDPIIDEVLTDFYVHVLGPYWDKERRFIDEKYQTIPFPFAEIKSPSFEMNFEWTLAELAGYINTWSAVQKFIQLNQSNPVDELINSIQPHWESERKLVTFPLFMRLGKIS